MQDLRIKGAVALAAGLVLIVVGYYFTGGQKGPSLTVLSPANGEIVETGSSQKISWRFSNVPADYKVGVNIRRIPPPALQEEGQEFDPLIFTDLPNTGSADWTVSDMYPPGTYVLGLTAYESLPVTDPVTEESEEFTIIPPLHADLYPLYRGVAWDKPHLYALELPEEWLYGTAVESNPTTDTMSPSEAFSPFDEYYRTKLKALGWKVDNSLLANGPASQQTVYRKGDDFIAVNFYTTFKVVSTTSPAQCPCDVRLLLFSR